MLYYLKMLLKERMKVSVKIKGCVNVDADDFLNDFLELQDQACGPTVDDFMQALLS